MIKKITNWTFGSIFRTIGRIIAYILIGLLISFIITKKEYVKADLINPDAYSWSRSPIVCTGGSAAEPANCNLVYETYTEIGTSAWSPMANEKGIGGWRFRYNFNNGLTAGVAYTFRVRVVFDTIDDGWSLSDLEDNTVVARVMYSTSTQDLTSQSLLGSNDTGAPVYFSFEEFNGSYDVFYINITYTPSVNAKYVEFYLITGASSSNSSLTSWGPIFWGYDNYYTRHIQVSYNSSSGGGGSSGGGSSVDITNSIENQTTIINNGFANITDSLTDENTTSATNKVSDFFSNFSTQDNGGISYIITAPLNQIRNLSTAQCYPIDLPLPFVNSSLTLPCLTPIYRDYFGAFFSIYQTIIFGAVAYRMLVSLFMMIEGIKNPDDDKIEVVDL